MSAVLDFDLNDTEPSSNSFDVLPTGKYLGQVVESSLTDTKAGTGKILLLTIEVLSQGFKGRKIFEKLNVRNPNPEAERISRERLGDLYDAVGLSRSERTVSKIHLKTFGMRLGIEKDKNGTYEDKNKVQAYFSKDRVNDSEVPNGKPQSQARLPPAAKQDHQKASVEEQLSDSAPFNDAPSSDAKPSQAAKPWLKNR